MESQNKPSLPWYQDQGCIMSWGKALGMVVGAAAIPMAVVRGVELGGIMSIAVSIFAVVISVVITNASDRRNEVFQRRMEDFMPQLGQKINDVLLAVERIDKIPTALSAVNDDVRLAISEIAKETPDKQLIIERLDNVEQGINATISDLEAYELNRKDMIEHYRIQDQMNRINANHHALADPNSMTRQLIRDFHSRK